MLEHLRFLEKVVFDDGCWNWQGRCDENGYGRFDVERNGEWHVTLAHRFSFELFVGVPDTAMVCHDCDNPSCVRPSHLYAGNALTNAVDRDVRGRHKTNGNERKTHCPQNHEYTSENTYMHDGMRGCRICRRARTTASNRARDAARAI